MKLTNQIAIISGGLGDIGSAIATELADCGADIAIGDIKQEAAAASVIASIQSLGRKAVYTQVDISRSDEVEEWINTTSRALGVPSLIIPNAAIARMSNIKKLSFHDWDQQLLINLNGAFYMSRAAANKLVEMKMGGRIVFIGSWAAHRVHRHLPAYCVGKAGLRMLSQCMAAEYAENGILVNEIAPGTVNAGLSAAILKGKPQVQKSIKSQIPVGKLIEPVEVAKQVAYLCDPDNHHITGSTLLMDGGLSLGNLNIK